ncbi:hypothetical protein PARPLA_02068 [Rhodobacteraceae bacterium THAF1]|nr:hypothetical protein FIU81_03740 [Palleronia sp. THAF1]VDC25596.1 hypothetical protein PARPLA_02068 [Rhodobacteraceae bacterium THAF1]
MKNPYMSAWLSAANQMAAPARGQMMAEASKMQTQMMNQWVEMWMSMWMPGTKRK